MITGENVWRINLVIFLAGGGGFNNFGHVGTIVPTLGLSNLRP